MQDDGRGRAAALEFRDAHDTLRLAPYLRELWRRRAYVAYVSVSELRSRQMASALGNLWHLLNPTLHVAVYYLIFGVFIGGVARGVENYVLFLAIGLFVFADIQRSTVAGGNSLANNKGLLRSLYFPRALIPITAVVTESLATLPSVLVVYATAIATGEPLRWTWIFFPVVLLGQFAFNVGLALFAARATHHVRDLQQILPFLFRLALYVSGVIFAVESFVTSAAQLRLFELNPIYSWLQIARWTIMGGSLETSWLLSVFCWTIPLFLVGLWWFRNGESEYGRD